MDCEAQFNCVYREGRHRVSVETARVSERAIQGRG